MPLELVSVELTNRCAKACWFCYNHSLPEGDTRWRPGEVVGFVRDCAAHGVRAVSFGGGEPLQFAGFCLGGIFGVGSGYLLAVVADRDNETLPMVLAAFVAGGCAAGGAIVGGVRDVLAYFHRRLPAEPDADYRDGPLQGLPPAPPITR
jgi:hypothetical protein